MYVIIDLILLRNQKIKQHAAASQSERFVFGKKGVLL